MCVAYNVIFYKWVYKIWHDATNLSKFNLAISPDGKYFRLRIISSWNRLIHEALVLLKAHEIGDAITSTILCNVYNVHR